MNEIRQFILDRLQEEYDLPKDVDLDAYNYMENGYIDSVALVSFVVELEDEFGISFSDEELTSHDFKTIGGLVKMITAKTDRK